MQKLTRVALAEAQVTPLPGRDWHQLMGPGLAPTERLSMGLSVYEPGARPEGHVHLSQEETIYCVSGRGRLVSETGTVELQGGVAVHVPVGLFHSTECDGPSRMELLCVFTPPVVPGSYEKGS